MSLGQLLDIVSKDATAAITHTAAKNNNYNDNPKPAIITATIK